jgi:thioredoxin
VVDLWAPWCGPCRMVSPALEQVARELAGTVKPVKVNVDEASKLSERFSVQSVPTLLVIREARTVDRRTARCRRLSGASQGRSSTVRASSVRGRNRASCGTAGSGWACRARCCRPDRVLWRPHRAVPRSPGLRPEEASVPPSKVFRSQRISGYLPSALVHHRRGQRIGAQDYVKRGCVTITVLPVSPP